MNQCIIKKDIINSLTRAQKKDLLELYHWCRQYAFGRGLRTGKFLAIKGLAKDTGVWINYSTKWYITDLGLKVAEELLNKANR